LVKYPPGKSCSCLKVKQIYLNFLYRLPVPELPPTELFHRVAFDAIAITIVSYAINISMAFIFAKRQNYEIRANQELLALVSNNSKYE
jgi:MFS superfamily sulfate permease-like transporter